MKNLTLIIPIVLILGIFLYSFSSPDTVSSLTGYVTASNQITGPYWTSCVSSSDGADCQEICGLEHAAASSECTTTREFENYAVETWYQEGCLGRGSGQQESSSVLLDGKKRWKCCCVQDHDDADNVPAQSEPEHVLVSDINSKCEDSDNGRDYSNWGEVESCVDVDGEGVCSLGADACVGSKTLKEYYCEDGFLMEETLICDGICDHGKCV